MAHRYPRSSGILLHPTSLPGPFGIGDIGPAAHSWIETLAEHHQTWWQILPVGPTGYGDSPYQSFSTFAGNLNLLSPELMLRDGVIERSDLDGYSFPRFFVKILVPLIASGIGVAAFFCFMFSWVELLLARTLTSVNAKPISAIMTRTVSASGMDWGLLAAAGVLTIIPGALVIWFVRNYIARGFALGRV